MKEINLTSKVLYCQLEELTESEQKLVNLAMKASDNSYAPYSRFRVGAVIRRDDGT